MSNAKLHVVALSLSALALACTAPAADRARHAAPPPPAPSPGTHDVGVAASERAPVACESENAPPQAPTILTPFSHAIVAGEELKIVVAPLVDADGDAHRATLYEVYDGGERVWSLTTNDPAQLTTARLVDGVFEHGDALDAWKDYDVRVSFEDDSGACNAWSAPSVDRVFRSDDGSAFFFDDAQVLSVSLALPQSTIDSINNEAAPPGCVQYQREAFPGSFTYGTQTFDDVGVSNKGGCGSARDLNGKAGLKVRLTWDDPAVDGCGTSQRLFGQKTVTLNNDVQDQSAAHERMGYRLYRAAGVPAPRAVSVNVSVNGALWGLYTMVETPDRRFLDRFFNDNDGMMYEGAYWCDLVPGNVPAGLYDPTCFEREFGSSAAPKDPGSDGTCESTHADGADWALLSSLTTQIQAAAAGPNFYQTMKTFFDIDEFISMWAVDGTISHWDAYSFHIMNNYRVYHDPADGLWRIMPWGIDQTFNGGGDVDPFSSDTVLVNACIADPECLQHFGARLHEVLDLFVQLDFAGEAQRIHDQIQPSVYADPRKEYDANSWESTHAALQTWIAERPAQVEAHLAAHGL